MKLVLNFLLLSVVCTTPTSTKAVPEIEIKEPQEENEGQARRPHTNQQTKPSSWGDRLRNLFSRNTVPKNSKKQPSTRSNTPQVNKPAADRFTGRTELTRAEKLAINRVAGEIRELRRTKEKFEINPHSPDNLQDMRRVIAASRVIDKALDQLPKPQTENLSKLKTLFENTRANFLEALIKDNVVEIDKSQRNFEDSLKKLITKINHDLGPQKTLLDLVVDEEKRIKQTLKDFEFAQIEDTDPATQDAYHKWQIAENETLKANEALKEARAAGDSPLGLAELDARLTFEKATRNLIAAIENSPHSPEAEGNWRLEQTFKEQLEKAKKLVAKIKNKIKNGWQFKNNSNNEPLLTSIEDANPDMAFEFKLTRLKRNSKDALAPKIKDLEKLLKTMTLPKK